MSVSRTMKIMAASSFFPLVVTVCSIPLQAFCFFKACKSLLILPFGSPFHINAATSALVRRRLENTFRQSNKTVPGSSSRGRFADGSSSARPAAVLVGLKKSVSVGCLGIGCGGAFRPAGFALGGGCEACTEEYAGGGSSHWVSRLVWFT